MPVYNANSFALYTGIIFAAARRARTTSESKVWISLKYEYMEYKLHDIVFILVLEIPIFVIFVIIYNFIKINDNTYCNSKLKCSILIFREF